MPKQSINVGATANDKKGDSLRAAFQKVNANFTELYTQLGLADDDTLNLGAFEFAGSVISTTDSTAVVIDQAVTVTSDLTVGGDVVPTVAQGGDLGSPTRPWRSLYVSSNTIFIGNVPVTVDGQGNLLVGGSAVAAVGTAAWDNVTGKPTFSAVATSGSYADLSNRPTIPADVGDLTDTGNLLFDGDYGSLTNQPVIPADVSDLTDTGNLLGGGSGSGDLVGPASATDNAITRFDSTTGKLVQNSLVTISDTGAITAPAVGSVIPFYFANQSAFPSAATYHGAVAHSHADGKMYFAHGSVWIALANMTDIPADVDDLTDTGNLLSGGGFSGSYNDLTDTPAIPADVSDLTDTTSLLGQGSVVNSITHNDDITLTINNQDLSTYVWTFGGDGNLKAQDGDPLQILSTGASGAVSMAWRSSTSNPENIALVIANSPGSQNSGTVAIVTGSPAAANIWQFGASGNLTFPNGTVQTTAYTGYHTGDVTGSLFSDGSTLLVDGVAGKIVGDVETARLRTSETAIALGGGAGQTNQGVRAVAIGDEAGRTDQGVRAVAIGYYAGQINQSATAVAMGDEAGRTNQGVRAVAIGYLAGGADQGTDAVAIGDEAGRTDQGVRAVAIGREAGRTTQGDKAVAIGELAGQTSQGTRAVAMGHEAGRTTQGDRAVAIGEQAGETAQDVQSVAIGFRAGQTNQSNSAVAIGAQAGETAQGAGAIAIGDLAGQTEQGNNSIVINATGVALSYTVANTFVVKPIRAAAGTSILQYDASTGEITHTNDIYSANGRNYVEVSNTGVVLGVEFGQAGFKEWTFDIAGDLLLPGKLLLTQGGVQETFQAKADATGVVDHDCSLGQVFYHTSPDANWTANFANLNLGTSASTNTVLVVEQGATPYYPSAVQIGGFAQTIKWLGNVTPTPAANKTEIATFTIFNNAGTFTVLGSYSTYG